jgi:hypothetical protein
LLAAGLPSLQLLTTSRFLRRQCAHPAPHQSQRLRLAEVRQQDLHSKSFQAPLPQLDHQILLNLLLLEVVEAVEAVLLVAPGRDRMTAGPGGMADSSQHGAKEARTGTDDSSTVEAPQMQGVDDDAFGR